MGTRGYRHREAVKIVRPTGIAFVAVVGILSIMAVFGLEIALVWLRAQRGLSFAAQGVDLAIAGMGALFLIWVYWGLWDLLASSWQFHVFLGLPLFAGFAYLAWKAPDLAPVIIHHVKPAELELGTTILRFAASGMAVLQLITFVVVLGSKEVFGIGKPKQPWERVRR